MNSKRNTVYLLLLISAIFTMQSFGNVSRESCGDLIQISIKGNTIDFSTDLLTITENKLVKAIKHANNEIGRRDDVINPEVGRNIMTRLQGVGLFGLGTQGAINCMVGVDDSRSRLMIIDSKNKISKAFKLCGPMIRRKKGFPFFKITWECATLWSYSYSKLEAYGQYGNGNGQFSNPKNVVTCDTSGSGDSVALWVADYNNDRIVQLRYSADGKMDWINSIGNFYRPIDIACRYDDEIPVLYVASEEAGAIIRIPVTDNNYDYYQDVEGYLQVGGIDIGTPGGFGRPTGVCLNRSGERDDWPNAITYVYVADAGNEKIYRFMEAGARLQYLDCVALPPLSEPRSHLGIRSDRFGTLYVFDSDAGKVRVYSQNLEPLGDFGSPGDHSSIDIKFNALFTGYVTGDNLFVVDKWSDNSGLQRFNIGGIDIVSASVDYAEKTATIVADNAFNLCTYSIDGDTTPTKVTGMQFSGSFTLDLSHELEGLAPGQHTLTVALRSAYSTDTDVKTSTKTIGFIVDPNADRQPRNIEISSMGRRIDIRWDAPPVTTGLSGYAVYVNNEHVYDCDAETFTYSWYASRDDAGVTFDIKLGAIFEQAVEFSNVTNFSVDGNSLQHDSGTTEASAYSVQQLIQSEWDSLPTGAAWTVNATMGADPDPLRAEPLLRVVNTMAGVDLSHNEGSEGYVFFGTNSSTGVAPLANDRIRLILVKTGNNTFNYRYCISRADGKNYSSDVSSETIDSFPLSVYYHSDTAGLKLENCTVGLENAMSSSIPVVLRVAGDVLVDGSDITLDDAVTTAFNGDNLLLSDAQYTLSVPLNSKPIGDNNLTSVSYTVSLDSSVASGKHATVTYSGSDNLIKSVIAAGFNLVTDISMSGVIVTSDAPLTIFQGSSTLADCDVSLAIHDCVLDAPDIKLVRETTDVLTRIPAGGLVNFDLSSSTLVMDGTDGLITLNAFTGLTLNMTDDLIYQKDFSSCFCFTNIDTLCSSPYTVTLNDNSFLLAQVCSGCEDKICDTSQNAIDSIIQGVPYFGQDYGVTNINNPGVVLNGNTGAVEEIRGAVKTVDGMAIGAITNPKLMVWPTMLARTTVNTVIDQCLFMPITGGTRVNVSMNSKGSIYASDDIVFTAPVNYLIRSNNDYWLKEALPGEIVYAYGENSFGLRTQKCALSFPGNVIFDEQQIADFYGAPVGAADVFAGMTSSDAASGSISWKVASLPIGGNPANGYEQQRTETFYEPLPEVTGYETLMFYYKKQYVDQQFSLVFEDETGVTHTIRNSALSSGTRGWVITTDAATLDWQQALITIKDEANLGTGELPMGGKLMRLTVHHESVTASTAIPSWMLFDDIVFQPLDAVIFDEQDPVEFTGKDGCDGWDGFTSTTAFTGSRSFKVVIKAGNETTSDEWTGFSAGPPIVDLPVTSNRRKVTFSYKKSDPNAYAAVKLDMQDLETNGVTPFEVSEQNEPGDLAGNGWPIPHQADTCWHQVFIDLFSVRGPGNTAWPDSSPMPFGKVAGVELLLSGTEGAQCLFDNIKFVQEYFRQIIDTTEQYTVSPDYSEAAGSPGWTLNSLGGVSKNTVITYGAANGVAIEENFDVNGEPASNLALLNKLEIEKPVTVSPADFTDAHIYWQERGVPIGYIQLDIGCTDGTTYPLCFSATGYSLKDAKGVFNFKARSDTTRTKHSYKVADVFNKCYPELVNASTPVTPVNVSSLKVAYQANRVAEWYGRFEYPTIDLMQEDTTQLAITVVQPSDREHFGSSMPVNLSSNKEIKYVTVIAKKGENIIWQWEYSLMDAGQTDYNGFCDLRQLNSYQTGPDGSVTISIKVTDIYGVTISEDRTIFIDWSVPSVTLRKPVNQSAYNGIVPLDGFSDIPVYSVWYRIVNADGNVIKEDHFDYSGGTTDFQDSISIEDADRFQKVQLYVYGTSANEMISPIVNRTIILNPSGTPVTIGTVTGSGVTWDTLQIEPDLCGASDGTGGTLDNVMFFPAQVFGNFEATLGVKAFDPSLSSAKAGLLARAELTTGSTSDFIFTSDSGSFIQYRQTTDQAAVQNNILPAMSGTIWFKLKRVGTELTYYTSADGLIFNEEYSRTIGTLPVYIGPAYTSGNATTQGCATFTGLSIEKLPDGTAEIALGITTKTRVLPFIMQDGVVASVEDQSTRNSGETIAISGTNYSTGIGGMPQSDGSPSFLIYDLASEASRLQVERFIRLIGIGGTQDSATAVAMQIKVANTTSMPDLPEWVTPTGQVYSVWNKPAGTNPLTIDLDLTGIRWLGIFISASPMYATRHGVWGDLTMEYIGSERKAPNITADPESITRLVGERAVFSVTAEGTLPLTYQWQKNHMNIPGANASAYMTAPVQLTSNGAVYRCVVTNDFGKEYSFDATLTVIDEPVVDEPQFAIIAGEHLDIRDQVSIVGSTILSNDLLTIGNDANVTAEVLAVGNISIGDRTEITGSVFAGGSVGLGSGTTITDGTVAGGQSISSVEIESRPVTYGASDKTVNNGVAEDIPPGDYRDLHAFSYSTLRFAQGTYNFRKVIFESNVTLVFELDGNETAIINSFDETRFGDSCDMSINGTAGMFAVQWYSNYAQEVPVFPDARFVGQLIVPQGSVHVYSRSIINGLCYAKNITIEPTAGLNYSRNIPSINQKPVFSMPATAVQNPVTGVSAAMSALGVDDSGEENLVYLWTAPTVPSGAWVNFSANNSNSAKNTVATFSAPGDYTLRVTAEDQYLMSAISTISVTVEQALTTIIVSPQDASVLPLAIQQFSASAKNQFGTILAVQPLITWSVGGGGAISATGQFTADSTIGGPYTVTATADSVSGTASVTTVNSSNPCAGVQGGGGGLQGATFGLNPPWSAGSEYCMATDGDTNTFYGYSQANGAYTGLDFGTARTIGQIRYYPRANYASRMNGGKFQGSNASSSSGFVDLYTISTTPAIQWNEVTISNAPAYRYIRYLAPDGGYGNIAEVEFRESRVFPDPVKWYKIATKADTGLCLDVSGGNYVLNDTIQLWTKVNVNQEFKFKDAGNGYYTITSRGDTAYSIDMSGNFANGQKLKLWYTQMSNANQKFRLISLVGGYYRLETSNPSFSIDNWGASGNGVKPALYISSDNNINQQWVITEVP
jgi:hypothetical protein